MEFRQCKVYRLYNWWAFGSLSFRAGLSVLAQPKLTNMTVQHREPVYNDRKPTHTLLWWFVTGSGPWEIVSKGTRVAVRKFSRLLKLTQSSNDRKRKKTEISVKLIAGRCELRTMIRVIRKSQGVGHSSKNRSYRRRADARGNWIKYVANDGSMTFKQVFLYDVRIALKAWPKTTL